MDNNIPPLLEAAQQLTNRLMRLSVDSHWARRSSGLRGSLIKEIDRLQTLIAEGQTLSESDMEHLEGLVRRGFEIIENAAREIRSIDDLNDDLMGRIRSLIRR